MPAQRAPVPAANVARAGAVGVTPGILVQTDTVNTPLYNAPLYTANRVASVQPRFVTASGRTSTMRSASLGTGVAEAEPTGPTMEEFAQLTDFCKAQFFACMDGFCDVLDDNQGRCSCSGNITKYAKTEKALKDATEELQDVAMKIQYLALSKDEVISLFTGTEAEIAMQGQTDTTMLRRDLDNIKKLVLDVKATDTYGTDSLFGLDFASLMDFDMGDGFDLSTLFTGGSVSNQRGADLYKTALARCKASVLETCRRQGVDTNIITNTYDLEIDRQCIMYERTLDDANTNMRRTVRNATVVLQKARLVVAQERNKYDARGCVNALDSCMQNDFVCGTDYDGCLDPTGKYIVNGEIVVGSQPGKSGDTTGLFAAWNYSGGNVWTSGDLTAFINQLSSSTVTGNTTDSLMLTSLAKKIGWQDSNGKNFGMCMSVLNRCQDLTFKNNKYVFDNSVVKEFLLRTMQLVKARQELVISSHAETCGMDLRTCLIANQATYGTDPSTYPGTVPGAAIGACNSILKTCASVTGTADNALVTAAICFQNKIFPTALMQSGGNCCTPQSGSTTVCQ